MVSLVDWQWWPVLTVLCILAFTCGYLVVKR